MITSLYFANPREKLTFKDALIMFDLKLSLYLEFLLISKKGHFVFNNGCVTANHSSPLIKPCLNKANMLFVTNQVICPLFRL